MSRRAQNSFLTLRAQEEGKEMTDAEKKEYEALMEEAQRLQGTFKSMIGGAFGDDDPEPEPEPQSEAPKGFAIPIEEYDPEDYTPDLETEDPEPIDLESMSPEERERYEMGLCQNAGDNAFEACETAIASENWAEAWAQHEECIRNYQKSGILSEGSIFKVSFMDCLTDQEKKTAC